MRGMTTTPEDLSEAAAALAAPGLTDEQLTEIRLAHPSLQATALRYPTASPAFLEWLSASTDRWVAGQARERIATLATQGQEGLPARGGSGGGLRLAAIGLVVALAIAAGLLLAGLL